MSVAGDPNARSAERSVSARSGVRSAVADRDGAELGAGAVGCVQERGLGAELVRQPEPEVAIEREQCWRRVEGVQHRPVEDARHWVRLELERGEDTELGSRCRGLPRTD